MACAFTPFETNTTHTSATFTGENGDTYSFYSVATDNAGNVQPTPTAAKASTLVNALSTTTLQDPTNPSMLGQSVPLTATVSAVISGSRTPTGSVTFEENGIPLPGNSTVTLVNGTASFSTSLLTPGSDSITAIYSGDDYFGPSTSAADSHMVNVGTLSIVNWTGDGDGVSWNDPNNWSGDVLPGQTDQVVIDVAGPLTINYATGINAVYDITSSNSQVNLDISGGSLSILATSTFIGNVQNSAQLIVAGGQLSLPGGATGTTGQFETAVGATVVFSATNQVVGTIAGAGNVVVEPNSNLTVDSIVQNTLTIGAGSTVTIAPSLGPMDDSTAVATASTTDVATAFEPLAGGDGSLGRGASQATCRPATCGEFIVDRKRDGSD